MEASSSRDPQSTDDSFQKTEFFSEDQLIEISPMVRSGVVSLLCGNYGPFEPSITTTVPMWLALALKKVHRCKVIPPRWLSIDRLKSCITSETENEAQLHDLPFYFFEITSLILHHAPDDVENAPQVRRYVEDLANARDSKMRRWMQANVRDRVNAIKINNLALHEIYVHRPVLSEILNNLYEVHVNPDQQGAMSETVSASNTATESETRPAQGRQLRRIRRT